jgi:hypothetical protein
VPFYSLSHNAFTGRANLPIFMLNGSTTRYDHKGLPFEVTLTSTSIQEFISPQKSRLSHWCRWLFESALTFSSVFILTKAQQKKTSVYTSNTAAGDRQKALTKIRDKITKFTNCVKGIEFTKYSAKGNIPAETARGAASKPTNISNGISCVPPQELLNFYGSAN